MPQPTADADEHADDDLADQLPGDPRRPPLRHRPDRREEDRRVDEGERQPVVEPGLARQGEAHLVVLVDLLVVALERRPLDLDVGGEHGVGGRQRRPEEQRPPGRRPRADPTRAARRRRSSAASRCRAAARPATRPATTRGSRHRSGRSSASPTPMSATSTVISVTCSTTGRAATGSSSTSVSERQQPDRRMPVATSTMGAESAQRCSSWGSTAARSRDPPSRR